MNIKDLNMHCGQCSMQEYCGEPWEYAICDDYRFKLLTESAYLHHAEYYAKQTDAQLKLMGLLPHTDIPECVEYKESAANTQIMLLRKRPCPCEGYYSERCQERHCDDEHWGDCEHYPAAQSWYCEKVADFVWTSMTDRQRYLAERRRLFPGPTDGRKAYAKFDTMTDAEKNELWREGLFANGGRP